MKALMKTKAGPGNVELLDVPEPPPCTPDAVKIEVKFSGVCGTDLHILHDTFPNHPPVILGHEFSGIVCDVGSGVTDYKPGDRVFVLPSTAVRCGKCEYCRSIHYWFCSHRRGLGIGVNGGFTQYAIAREDMVYRIPDQISLKQAALAEPLAVAVQAVEELTEMGVADTVLISGPGPIGLLCLALLLAKGCKVIVAGTSVDAMRLDLAKKMGADVVVNVSNEDLIARVQHETNGTGVDIAIECAGAGPSVAACLKALRKLGRYVQVGLFGKDITLSFDTVVYKQLRICGSGAHSLKSWDRVVKIMDQGKVRLDPVISHTLKLSEWQQAFDLCADKQSGKVLMVYD